MLPSTLVLLSAVDLDDFSFSVPSQYTLVIEDSTGYTDSISFNITRCARRRRDLTATPLLARYERDIIKSLHFSELTKLVYLPITYQMGLKLPLQFCMSDLSLAISYSLLLANHSDWPFVIGSASGEIEVFRPLYRLTYHLVEQCSNPLHEQIASYVIVVLLESDYTPVFNEVVYAINGVIYQLTSVSLPELLHVLCTRECSYSEHSGSSAGRDR